MRIKNGFELRKICGENIIVAHGLDNIDFTKVISMNESAADIWNSVFDRDFTVEDMVKALLDNYQVDEKQAVEDSEALLKQWIEAGLVEYSL